MHIWIMFVLFGLIKPYPNGNLLLNSCWNLIPIHENTNTSLNRDSPFKISIENTFGTNVYIMNDRLAGNF
jgi:hypothetical protein